MLIPTGEIAEVKGTPLDFSIPTIIGDFIHYVNEQIKFGTGYGHNWGLNAGNKLDRLAARISEQRTGRSIEVYTNELKLQFY